VKLESDLIDCRDVIPLFIAVFLPGGHDANARQKFRARRIARDHELLLPSRRILSGEGRIFRSPSYPTRVSVPLANESRKTSDDKLRNLANAGSVLSVKFAENMRSLDAQTIARASRSDASYVKEFRRDANSLPRLWERYLTYEAPGLWANSSASPRMFGG